MKLYVCWATVDPSFYDHPCGTAHSALREAGHDPEIVKAYGWVKFPDALNNTKGRKEAEELTGSKQVPVLVTDDEQVIYPTNKIVEWAKANPARATAGASQG
ncbi:MAG: glutathione S-transferase N-terminal domain-containing protein [Solirubrobacterales bacterium]